MRSVTKILGSQKRFFDVSGQLLDFGKPKMNNPASTFDDMSQLETLPTASSEFSPENPVPRLSAKEIADLDRLGIEKTGASPVRTVVGLQAAGNTINAIKKTLRSLFL